MDNRGWEKSKFSDGLCYYVKIVECVQSDSLKLESENDESKIRIEPLSRPQIRFRKITQPTERLKVILAQNGKMLGEAQANIYGENYAIMELQDFGGRGNEWRAMKDLPEDLEGERETFNITNDAIWIDQKRRGKGLGSRLMGIVLRSLFEKGINRLEVNSIVEGRMSFYENNGATVIDKSTAVYEDIGSIVKEREDVRDNDSI